MTVTLPIAGVVFLILLCISKYLPHYIKKKSHIKLLTFSICFCSSTSSLDQSSSYETQNCYLLTLENMPYKLCQPAIQPVSQKKKKKANFKLAFRLKFVETHFCRNKKKVNQGRYTTEHEQMSNKARYNTDLLKKTRGTMHQLGSCYAEGSQIGALGND